ncbi:MAG TPA: ferric iron uptake transcriptional regulator [Sedimenticola thiotaurini]|uniref:Ferric uptake regulation protein n=1 Tax=Sedimenticola thiotaurini TaxID=1543721 RepID=A0A831RPV3_9GAMM|nr:ferric iron uptake transcriptional regulator [Sedimenticola thiotaurini]
MTGQEIRDAGLKVTAPRLKILELLEQGDGHHVSAEEVYRQLTGAGEEIGLATVYRVLTQFEAAGLVQRHNFEGGHSVFELNRGEHHDHIICTLCGRVKEFVDPVIERRQQEIARDLGFELADHSLTIYGRCKDPDCPNR